MSEWINCIDALPKCDAEKTSARVLAWTNERRYYEAIYDYDHESWRDWHSFLRLTGVTHWMPLPEPPMDNLKGNS